ncbi:MAG: penicillin-binding protein 2 [Proteobacteria bacterium]|nr:penicillin-binding protein 2 [Pseudomonadota bacterium]
MFFAILAVVLGKALYLQVVRRPALEIQSERQHNQTMSIKLQRGPIYDSNRNILAVSLPMDSIFAIPTEVEHPEHTSKQLSRILGRSEESIYKKLTAKVTFTWLQRNPKPMVSEKVENLNLPGIYNFIEYQRFYPLKDHAAQLIGFSGIDSQGLEGLEFQYDAHLMDGTDRHSIWRSLYGAPELNNLYGGSLVLTINSRLQYFAEKELKKALHLMKAKHGIAIIMESQTGKILSIANMPDFDPNNFGRYNRSTYFNRAVSAAYEPGSTFKIVTIATALENDVIAKDNIFNCENGEYQIQDRIIHDVAKFGWLPLAEIIKKSSNICAAKIGQQIPKPVFYKMIREFGFGSKTGISLPGEALGKVHNYQNWSATDVATISYGHSISATPIQIITAINTIATGGIMIRPSVVEEARNANGKPVPFDEQRKKRILKKEVAETVNGYMVGVTEKGGTGYSARIAGLTIAGKTGTSRKVDIKKQEYSSKKHIRSFVGFFPADNPKLTILVMIDEPKKGYLGIKSAAPVFRKIAEHTLRYYPETQPFDNTKLLDRKVETRTVYSSTPKDTAISPEKSPPKSIISLLKGKTFREVLTIADREKITVHVKGSGKAKRIVKDHSRKNTFTVYLR